MHSAAIKYLYEIDRQLVCPGYLKRRFLRQLKNEVAFFCEDHADADTDHLLERFGAPEEVAQAFLTELAPKMVSRYHAVRRALLLTAVGILLPVIAIASVIGIRTKMIKQQLPNDAYVALITYEEEAADGSLFSPRGSK